MAIGAGLGARWKRPSRVFVPPTSPASSMSGLYWTAVRLVAGILFSLRPAWRSWAREARQDRKREPARGAALHRFRAFDGTSRASPGIALGWFCEMGSLGAAPPRQPLVGQTLVFSGRLLSLGRPDARTLVERLGAHVTDDLSAQTTMLVVGAAPHRESQKLRRAEQMNAESPGRIRIMSEDEFCELVGMMSPSTLRQQYHAQRDLLERYPH